MKAMPDAVAQARRNICRQCDCGADVLDPCAACPVGRWGNYVPCEPDLPPPMAMAANLAQAVATEGKAMLQGVKPPTEEEVRRRLAICEGCQTYYRPSDARCAHPGCGCYLNKKAAWRGQRCPMGKW